MLVAHRVDDQQTLARRPRALESGVDRRRALLHDVEGDEPHLAARLALQHAHEVGVAHRRQRMILHRTFRQQDVADEEIALVDRSLRGGESRAGDGEIRPGQFHQRFRHRPDIAFIGGIEGGAIFEDHLLGARRTQRPGGVDGQGHGLGGGDGAGFQRDHHRFGFGEQAGIGQGADHLHRLHALARDHQGEIGSSGQIVGNGAQKHLGSLFRRKRRVDSAGVERS